MTSRRRNLFIIALVLGLLVASAIVIAKQPTRLGLDLRGGVELVYQGQPTPKVPKVTPQAVEDAIETIRKRTDALGVSEPEIQRAGPDQIRVGLPDVENAQRAIEQVGTTAQLQFYDWEPNIVGRGGRVLGEEANTPDVAGDATVRPIPSLFEAVKRAAKAKPQAEPPDIPPGGPDPAVARRLGGDRQKLQQFYDRQNDTGEDKLYLFGPERKRIAGPAQTCRELLTDFEAPAGAAPPAVPKAKGAGECQAELAALGRSGPPPGSTVLRVPRGIVVVQAERPRTLPRTAPFDQYYVLEDDSELSGADITNPEQNFDQQSQEPIVTMEFTERGRRAFAAATQREAQRGVDVSSSPDFLGAPRENAFQRFAITLDNQIVSLATIDFVENPEGIDGRTGAQINGIGSLEETQALAENLRIGALPIGLKLISQTQVSATLGQQALEQGLVAAAVGLALTLLFLVTFYRVLGVVASVALVIYAVLLYAVVELIPITLTLPGIAGMILTLGVAADANIVIFERIKEEVRAGRSIPASITGGYGKALRTIADANVVTLGVAFILFMIATAGVKGFAFTLLVGTLISLLTAVVATAAVLGAISRSRVLRSPHALGAGRQRAHWRFDFVGRSRWFFSMSGVIIAAGAIAIAGLGINFGIDFESGTRAIASLERPADTNAVRDALRPLGYGDAKIQQVDDPELGPNVVQISTPTLQPEQVSRVEGALDATFGVPRGGFSTSSVGPTFGEQIANTAVIAIIASLILISIYMGVRFEFKFAIPVLIALAHDILITAGVYSLTAREVTTATVAALLTILGYSLYDTIIVFDRIRENVPRMPRATFSQIVNRSMSEVLTRSLVTQLCTLLPVTALLLFGGETLRDFAFALLVGVASGAYSSVFIASPVLTAWKEREPVYVRRRQLVAEDHDGVIPPFAEDRLGEERKRPERARRAPSRAAAPGQRARAGGATTATGPRRAVADEEGRSLEEGLAPEREEAPLTARAEPAEGRAGAAPPGPPRASPPEGDGPAAPGGDGRASDAGPRGVRGDRRDGGARGDGGDAGGEPAATGGKRAQGARKQKPKRKRARKRHGRR